MAHSTRKLIDTPTVESLQRALREQQTEPTMAVLFHTRGQQQLALVTAHEIKHDSKRNPSLMPGRPLTPEDEMKILQLLRPQAPTNRFRVNPTTLLHATASSTMWWLPPSRRPMILLPPGREKPVIHTVPWPSLVLLAQQRRLFVVAVAGSERPTADSACYAAPLGNIWLNTECCVGSAVLPETCDVDAIDGWNRVLCESAFTHANTTKILRQAGKRGFVDPMVHWRKAPRKPLSDAQLVPLKFELQHWIDYTHAVERH